MFCCFFAAIAGEEHDQFPDTVLNFNEVAVVARRQPLASAQSISGVELQKLSSTSIADALKYFAGVQIKDYGGLGGLKTINVRSLGAQHVGVYIDGVRLTNAQNGTIDLGKYSLDARICVALQCKPTRPVPVGIGICVGRNGLSAVASPYLRFADGAGRHRFLSLIPRPGQRPDQPPHMERIHRCRICEL